jgi:hypothetical protein
MKKLIIILILAIGSICAAQSPFKPVPDLFGTKGLKAGGTYSILWRFDATIQLTEVIQNKITKDFDQFVTVGVGPAFGLQHFVPKSSTDPTPFNNYGLSIGALLGQQFKFVLQANLMQYFKFGVAFTPNPLTDLSHFGLFFGTGITF